MDRKYALLLVVTALCGDHLFGQAWSQLTINNAQATLFSNGLIGPAAPNGNGLVVPAATGLSPLYTSGLWVGGTSPDNQLKFAAHLYGSPGERDFFPGPLTIDGNASITPEVSAAYDQVWTILQSDVVAHRTFTLCQGDPDCIEAAFPDGYTIPASFLNWPAEGNVEAGYAAYLAPFLDWDGDGTYDPSNGDHPCVLGDQALYAIFNDRLDVHTQSGGGPIGLEVHMMPFAYTSSPALDHTVFVHYKLINRGTQTLTDFRIGHFADFDLGCGDDDVVGTDVGRNLVYVANGTDNDASCVSGTGYGTQPPAFGMAILKGPLLEPDGLDNTTEPVIPAFNGTGYNDGILDNERHGLSSSMYFLRSGPAEMTDPAMPVHYYNQLRSTWKNNLLLTHGGSGYSTDPNAVPALFAFPGDSDPLGLGTGGVPQASWAPEVDLSAGLVDPRAVASMGPTTLEPGEHITLLVAYVYARAGSGGAEASVAALQQRVDSIRTFAEAIPGMFTLGEQEDLPCDDAIVASIREDGAGPGLLSLFPNPVSDQLLLRTEALQWGSPIQILDARGRVVAQLASTGDITLFAVTDLPNGLYLLRVSDGSTPMAGRFVKE